MSEPETKPAAEVAAAAPDAVPAEKPKDLETPAVADAVSAPAAPAVSAAPAAPPAAPAAPVAAADTVAPETDKVTPELTPIAQLWTVAKSVAASAGHGEIWGVTLSDPETHVPTQIVLQKYLNANDGDLAKATDQLTKTLEWRAKTKPLELLKKAHDSVKFEGLGFVTAYGGDEPDSKEVFTWNIYGATKSVDETFGKLEEFIEWRVALMELALQELSLSSAVKPITAENDPYKITQVHDYKSISFLRQSPHVKSASSETIKVFAQNYPELLKEKFFVNVPAIMGFLYSFIKLFVAPKTAKKFHPMSNGGNLASEFADSKVKGLGEQLPAEYGGKAAELKGSAKGPLLT
ncbi:CRAL-TRIO domain-containing protein [Lasiosphaeria ovina]|uniref:Phosphatidylinositol transfer protein SFH5 n=1 Tax=Lasiosphaeria ovina TaxID=92902 RepID=A0AAE0NAI9_9PEZI|nr:CRAL-TRIO domain-containing protein [Lasiosphaeria ovina]